jgi:hypothetical protein
MSIMDNSRTPHAGAQVRAPTAIMTDKPCRNGIGYVPNG